MLLYLFLSLPIWIPTSVIRMTGKIISTFILQKKKSRLKHKLLVNPKNQGGLNFPNMKLYYWTAQLHFTDRNCLDLEKSAPSPIPLELLPFLEQKRKT